VIGILLAQFVNWRIGSLHPLPTQPTADQIAASWAGQTGWRWMFGATAIPALVFLIGVCFVPESPRWLAKRGDTGRARTILGKIGGAIYADAALADITATLSNEIQRVNFRDLLAPKLKRMLMLGVALAVLQQWCGINVIFYYAKDIFRESGFNVADILLNIVFIGSVNLVATLVALQTVDRWGRRPLMLLGTAAMGASLLSMGAMAQRMAGPGADSGWMLLLIVLYIAAFSLSVGPVTWVILAEIFPTAVRGRALGLATFFLWVADYAVTQSFPIMDARGSWLVRQFSHAFPFYLYAAFCAVLVLVVWRFVPETKGRTLEQIEQSWNH